MRRSFRKCAAVAALACGLGAGAAPAQEIGVTISNFNDNFLTLLREAMSAAAEENGVTLLFEDAQLEVGRQLSQVQNFAASGLDGMIIAPVDGGSTAAMSQAAEQAGLPVVYTNNLPVNLADLPENQVFVGSLETESGAMQGEEILSAAASGRQGDGDRRHPTRRPVQPGDADADVFGQGRDGIPRLRRRDRRRADRDVATRTGLWPDDELDDGGDPARRGDRQQ